MKNIIKELMIKHDIGVEQANEMLYEMADQLKIRMKDEGTWGIDNDKTTK